VAETAPLLVGPLLVGLAVALGIGLLIGVDRERRKGDGPSRGAAGLRTFAIVALSGAAAFAVGGELMVGIVTAGVIVLAALSYWRSSDEDPGITTEATLVLTALLGALAMREPLLAAGLGVLVAGLLHARIWLHGFVSSILSEEDVRDALILAGATLIVLPLLPDRAIGPYGALNLHALWIVVILVMCVSAVGYVTVRLVGARFGLPITGLASGFISSIATIGAMGERARSTPADFRSAVAGAVLSTVATIVQMAVVLAATNRAVLEIMAIPLLCAGAVAAGYGAFFTLWALHRKTAERSEPGRAFSLSKALLFAAILAAIVVVSAACREWFGATGTLVAAAASGFADTHAAAVSMASLVSTGRATPGETVIPILAALSTNTLTKMVFAATSSGRVFAMAVIPGLALVALAAWGGAFLPV
jgi:uncharacterized membrane protein (DUF4010 family)